MTQHPPRKFLGRCSRVSEFCEFLVYNFTEHFTTVPA